MLVLCTVAAVEVHPLLLVLAELVDPYMLEAVPQHKLKLAVLILLQAILAQTVVLQYV
jgi:hypothetical protein